MPLSIPFDYNTHLRFRYASTEMSVLIFYVLYFGFPRSQIPLFTDNATIAQ
jgi:hypothetical protein